MRMDSISYRYSLVRSENVICPTSTPHPERGGKQVRPGTKVLNGPQELNAVALFLKGIVRCGNTLHGNVCGLELQGLLGVRRQCNGAGDDQRGADILRGNILIIGQRLRLHYNLKVAEAGAVIEFDEAEALEVPNRADPAAHGDCLPGQRLAVSKNFRDFCIAHLIDPSFAVIDEMQ